MTKLEPPEQKSKPSRRRTERPYKGEPATTLAELATFERSERYRVEVKVKRRHGEPPYVSTCGFLLTPAGAWLPAQRPVNWRGPEIPQLLVALHEAQRIIEVQS